MKAAAPALVLSVALASFAPAKEAGPEAAAVAVSTTPAAKAPAPARAPVSPWSLQFGQDRRGPRVAMNFRLRWDETDFRGSPASVLALLRNPFNSMDLTMRGIAEGTRLDIYGVHVRPFHDMLAAGPVALAPAGPAAAPAGSARRRSGWLKLDPVLDDLRSNAGRDARRWLIENAFDQALPKASLAPYSQKEAVTNDLMDMGRSWRSSMTE